LPSRKPGHSSRPHHETGCPSPRACLGGTQPPGAYSLNRIPTSTAYQQHHSVQGTREPMYLPRRAAWLSAWVKQMQARCRVPCSTYSPRHSSLQRLLFSPSPIFFSPAPQRPHRPSRVYPHPALFFSWPIDHHRPDPAPLMPARLPYPSLFSSLLFFSSSSRVSLDRPD